MRKLIKKTWAVIVSLSMMVSLMATLPLSYQKNVYAQTLIENSLVTDFSYKFAYTTPGYADGTIYVTAKEDGVFKIFWGDENGKKLSKDGHEYSYLARVVVKDGKGSYNIISDYTAIPQGAKTVLVYRKDALQYVYDIPKDKQFQPEGDSYTFGTLSDLHYGRYSSIYDDDAVPAVDNALDFYDHAGIDFVGISGDITTGGEQTSLDKYNAALAKHPDMTVISCIGNHDSRTTVSTSDSSKLDTSITRWYNSISSKYFTVNEDGTVNNNLKGYPILSNDALLNPIATQYRKEAGAQPEDLTVPGLDFVTEAGDNIFIFLNEIVKTGETYDTDALVSQGQMDWLEEQLETYKGKKVFLFFHSFLGVNTLKNDVVDYNNCTGDLKNDGGYSYDLDFKDTVTTTSGLNMQALFDKYANVTMFSGHSHWQYAMQELNANINIGKLKNGEGATLFHISSVSSPRYIGKTDPSRTDLNGYESEGTTVTVYDNCIVYNCVDFYNSQYEAYATYIVPAGNGTEYKPVKSDGYIESADAIVGEQYLDAEDLTTLQLLKSDYNLLLGAGYQYSSKGEQNKDGTLTDGLSTGDYMNTKENKANDQFIIVTLDSMQKVSNLKNFMLYFVNGSTDSSSFNIQLSQDGENYVTVGNYTNMTYKTTMLDVDISNVSFDTYKYVKLNLTGGSKAYGYQIREFAAIGYGRNENPNTAGSASSLIDGILDETDLLDTDYNLIYSADYTQSTVGGENKAGALTDGKLSGFANTERNSSAKDQTFVIDLGKAKIQEVDNLDYFLLYSQNTATNVTDFDVSISLDGENYETVGTYSNVDIDTTHFDVDKSSLTLEKFRFVKLHLSNGNTGYGYQIKEFAVIGVRPIEYPEITDQSQVVASTSNLALNKQVYVSSTYAGEGSDPTVLTDGKTDKHWSSDWDSKRTSDYIVVDLGENYDASKIASVLVNYKSNNTYCNNYTVEFSATYDENNPTAGFYEVAKTKAASWEALQKISDANGYAVTQMIDVEPAQIRYVKINMNGHESWGFQVLEVAVIEKEREIIDISGGNFDFSEDANYTYSGTAIKPEVSNVTTASGETLTEEDYKVTYSNNVNAGKASITVEGIGYYKGTITKEFTIFPLSIESDEIRVDDSQLKTALEFNGKDRTPIVKLYRGNALLNVIADYMTEYSDNFYPGTATVTITGIDNYTGTITRTFHIIKKPVGNVTVRTGFNEYKQLVVTVNNGSYAMTKGVDYDYTVVTDAKGNITITFTGLGEHYSGSFVKIIPASENPNAPTVEPTTAKIDVITKIKVAKTKIKKIKNVKKKKVKLSWKKISSVNGYEIRYATSKKMKKAKVKIVKKNSAKYTIKKLKKKKKYYVQVRAYKVYKGITYYGKWSKKKKIKIKK